MIYLGEWSMILCKKQFMREKSWKFSADLEDVEHLHGTGMTIACRKRWGKCL